ncbi:MAG: DUF898 domain-containing protein [Rickettsiales bacterium]|jgi:uncharacterized membrane protein YjgN (DUF898 family)|nr:DUF898 domain-containing protein [Rickettsiales bacterium]
MDSTAFQNHRLTYDARDGQVIKIWSLNLLLKIVTLGVYTFWGKTRLRRYVTGSFSLLGDRFEYTGTGGELFRGFLKALPIIIVLYFPLIYWNPEETPIVKIMFIPILYLIFVGAYTGQRYRLSRTNWRGIRGYLAGSALQYGKLRLGYALLAFITLGLSIPYGDVEAQRYRISHMQLGSAKASFNGNYRKIFGVHLITWLLAIPTLGISRFWYKAALARHIYESTTIGNITFKGSHTGSNMLGLFAGNLLLLILTFGFAVPLVIQRNMNFLVNNLTIIGDLETSDILQVGAMDKSGEGIDTIMSENDIGFL